MKKLTVLFFLTFSFLFVKMEVVQAEFDNPYKWYLEDTNANEMHRLGITGKGVPKFFN